MAWVKEITPAPVRFWSKVNFTDSCWLWTAHKVGKGYGRYWANGRMVLAHRFSYELLVGPIPEGLQIDHLCRIRECVNPRHLEVVTGKENQRRGHINQNTRKTHCPQDHPYDEVNTLISCGKRYCRTCRNTRRREARAWSHLLTRPT